MLDGYLTAIVIGPSSIPPDEWFVHSSASAAELPLRPARCLLRSRRSSPASMQIRCFRNEGGTWPTKTRVLVENLDAAATKAARLTRVHVARRVGSPLRSVLCRRVSLSGHSQVL